MTKNIEEITSLANQLNEIDNYADSRSYERHKALSGLCSHVLNEVIAGRPVPVYSAEQIIRISGVTKSLANGLVRYSDEAKSDRSTLADEMEKLDSEEGRKAATILRQMNAAASPSFFLDGANLTKEDIDALSNMTLEPGQTFELKSYFPSQNFSNFKSRAQLPDEIDEGDRGDEQEETGPQPVVVLKTEAEVKDFKELFPGARLVSVSGSLCSAFRSWVSDEIYIARHAKTDDVLDYARGRQEVFKNPRLAVLDFETIVSIFSKN